MRTRVARRYDELLADICHVPCLTDFNSSAWAQYTLKIPERNNVQKFLKALNIPSVVYYPIPLSKQIGYQSLPCVSSGVNTSESLAKRVLSIPMHPYLKTDSQILVAEAIKKSIC